MSDEEDGEESEREYPPDIHGYVQYRLDEEGLDPRKDPMQVSELIEKAASDYIVTTDSEEIEDYEYHYITAVRIATMISAGEEMFHKQADSLLSEFGDAPLDDETVRSVAERSARYVIGNNVTLVYSMAYEFVNDMLERLLPQILSDDVDEGTDDVLLSQIGSYPGRADLLAKAGVIDKETREGIRHIREVRRDLVHDVEERFTLSTLDDLNKIDELPGLLNELYEKMYDQPAYRYIDD
ncbi:hypothetical protein [Haloarcula sp. 1CSR25-25]|jgi:uncharacterized protein YutE (UPF0331/DUF86 family)|uniref:hypothetical protein n=1 Tax=Haloarcula sp. 1CSR25-25 TaxID=2862545 RepID=UPI0028941203|nr:hypothetical protein [Haloarcula sp. 1CSR25-25]MDT3437948.1 hypothetical protein [Haloarcula sp. 1CSR25-25]